MYFNAQIEKIKINRNTVQNKKNKKNNGLLIKLIVAIVFLPYLSGYKKAGTYIHIPFYNCNLSPLYIRGRISNNDLDLP